MYLTGSGVLQIEPSDHCNLQCKMCAPHRDSWSQVHGIAKGHLSVQLWEKILMGFVTEQISFDHIIFQWLGDPLLHPQLDYLISRASTMLAKQVGYLRVDTNAILLDARRAQNLVQSACGADTPPLLMVFSIDAASPEVYLQTKGRDMLRVVRKNIRYLLHLRKKHGKDCNLNVQMQFVVQPENAHETKAFLNYWKDLLGCYGGSHWHDEIMFKRLSVDGGAEGQAHADALYGQHVFQRGIVSGKRGNVSIQTWKDRPWQNDDSNNQARTACPGLWMTPVIRHDGHLMMCCADLHGELNLGSLAEHSFKDLWEGEKADAIRMKHLNGIFDGVCKSCGGINWYTLQQKQIDETKSRRAT